ncbi:hypothetical protein CXB51_004124 [Gossypium anomalum]|uniref:SWIM-type domain-containing protein n=1 Tax=Gossypium anomalum TaxID=47600 RepID=A0A8J5ZHW4_9ROSI|nr:hypothetical protein CXB51_004124 [Gossypium anomalum]
MYFSDGDDDEELQEARQKVREVEGKTSGKAKEAVPDETEIESSREFDKEEEGNKTEYFDSDDQGSILGSDDNDNTDACKRRSKFPTYNPNSASPHFCIGIVFTDGEQFKFAIRKYLMCCERELKIIKNKLNRVRVKCIASKKRKWGIFASYSNMSRCMQVKSFHDEHSCCISFRNIMVNVKVIVDHFEATIRDHSKMKPREIQRRSTTDRECEQNKEELYKIDEEFESLDQSLLRVAHVSDIVNNNLCEAFNFSIVESRFKNIITMLKEIRVKIMTRIYNYGPLIKEKFADSKKEGVDWKMIWNGENGCEVKKDRKQYIINVEDKTCSCRTWQLPGIFCPMPAMLYGILNKILMTTYIGHMSGENLVLSPCFHQLRKQCLVDQRRIEGRQKLNQKKVKHGQLSRAGLIMRFKSVVVKVTIEDHAFNLTQLDQRYIVNIFHYQVPKYLNLIWNCDYLLSQFGMSTRIRSQKKNNRRPCIQPNTTGSQVYHKHFLLSSFKSGTFTRTRSKKRMVCQEHISIHECTAAKKMKKK